MCYVICMIPKSHVVTVTCDIILASNPKIKIKSKSKKKRKIKKKDKIKR